MTAAPEQMPKSVALEAGIAQFSGGPQKKGKADMTLEERMEKVEAVTTLAYRRSRLALMLGLGAAALSVVLALAALWIAWHVG